MKTSGPGIVAIKRREGSRSTMYRDQANLPTIGVGHLLTKDELTSGKLGWNGDDWHSGLSDQQIGDLLANDLGSVERAITAAVKVALTQTQFDTLVSFVFNVGVMAFLGSTLLKLLNVGDYASVPIQLHRWIYAAGQPVLLSRRLDEIAQWDSA